MDYPCGKFDDCSFSHFGSILWTDRHIHTERYTPATLVGVSNYWVIIVILAENNKI